MSCYSFYRFGARQAGAKLAGSGNRADGLAQPLQPARTERGDREMA